MTQKNFDVIVLGGGLHGLSAAIYCAKAGCRTLVLEKDYPGRHASGVNAGGVRRLGRHSAEIPLSIAAMEHWHAMPEFVGHDCGFNACGQIKIAQTETQWKALQDRVAHLQSMGFTHEKLVSAEDARALVPALTTGTTGAIWCAQDGAANPYHTVQAFATQAKLSGVSIHCAEAAHSIVQKNSIWYVSSAKNNYQAHSLINATGSWAEKFTAQLQEPVSLTPTALMLMISERCPTFLTPVLGAQNRKLSFKQLENGTVLIGGGYAGDANLLTNRAQIDLAGLSQSAQTVQALFPQLGRLQIIRSWAGLEGITNDNLPVIGPSANADNCFHSFGYCGHGFQLSPITGKIISELVTSGQTSLPIAAFDIRRFAQL